MSIEKVVADLKAEFFTTQLAVGKTVDHPTHGPVVILAGCFWDPVYCRLSNWWTWRKADDCRDKPQTYSGYGWM